MSINQEDYADWVKKMDEKKYRHYIAWFNVNIKQANSSLDDLVDGTPPEEAPDFRIHVPLEPVELASNSVLDRLKQTAYRRQSAMQPTNTSVVTDVSVAISPL